MALPSMGVPLVLPLVLLDKTPVGADDATLFAGVVDAGAVWGEGLGLRPVVTPAVSAPPCIMMFLMILG